MSRIMRQFFGRLHEGQDDIWPSYSGECEVHCVKGSDAHSLVGVSRHFRGICCLCVSPNSLLLLWKLKRCPKVHSTWTHSTEQRAWEAYSYPTSQEICRVLWKPKYKRPPLVPVSGHLKPVHAFPSRLFLIHLNIILPSTPRFAVWSFSFRFPWQLLYLSSPYVPDTTCRATVSLWNKMLLRIVNFKNNVLPHRCVSVSVSVNVRLLVPSLCSSLCNKLDSINTPPATWNLCRQEYTVLGQTPQKVTWRNARAYLAEILTDYADSW